MRALDGDIQVALAALADSVASDLGVSTIDALPPAPDADRTWSALSSSGLLTLRADGAGAFELIAVAEAFGRHLSAAPFIGATLASELLGPNDARIVIASDGLAVDALGAERLVTIDGSDAVVHESIARDRTIDRSRSAASSGSELDRRHIDVDIDRTVAITRALFAADAIGTALGAIDDAVAYALEREQFGVRIGTFQAVQHLLADAWVDVIGSRNALRSAAWRLDHDTDDAFGAIARASLIAAESARSACETAIQVLGGIGHTWEHLAGVRLRRVLLDASFTAHLDDPLLGAPCASAPTGTSDAEGFDLRDDSIEAAFRAELRAWLDTDPPTDDWHRTLAGAGFVGVAHPTDAGGRGLPVTCDAILSEELGTRGSPPPPAIGHLAHALATFATDEQRRVHLAGLLDGSVTWCQGFSEPGAGSDLAGIRTRAVRDGDDWIVNGRKIWTSGATESQMCLLLCRTDDHPHRGLSVLLVALDSPGIEIGTIITSWGSEEFAEVAFDDVRVPASAMLGNEGRGWEIAMSLLAVERGPADIGWISTFRRTADRLLADPSASCRHAVRRAVAWLEALDATVAVTLSRRVDGTHDTSAGSIDKLLMTKVDQLLHTASLDLAGADALDADGPELERYLWARAASTFGGTSQIQRTIVAQRLLGLPRP